MYSFMSSVLYVFKSIFSSNIYCIIIMKIYNPNVSFLGMGTGTVHKREKSGSAMINIPIPVVTGTAK